jgi:hypothetical protein
MKTKLVALLLCFLIVAMASSYAILNESPQRPQGQLNPASCDAMIVGTPLGPTEVSSCAAGFFIMIFVNKTTGILVKTGVIVVRLVTARFGIDMSSQTDIKEFSNLGPVWESEHEYTKAELINANVTVTLASGLQVNTSTSDTRLGINPMLIAHGSVIQQVCVNGNAFMCKVYEQRTVPEYMEQAYTAIIRI